MINWLKNEYEAFKQSRTIRVAYAKKLAGLVVLILANLSYFQGSISSETMGGLLIGLGFLDNYLRKITSEPL